jgi:hypothetical protein
MKVKQRWSSANVSPKSQAVAAYYFSLVMLLMNIVICVVFYAIRCCALDDKSIFDSRRLELATAALSPNLMATISLVSLDLRELSEDPILLEVCDLTFVLTSWLVWLAYYVHSCVSQNTAKSTV